MGDSSKYQLQRAVIFKGATRPPCILGIPIVPFIFVGGGVLILSFLIWIPLIFLWFRFFGLCTSLQKMMISVFYNCI